MPPTKVALAGATGNLGLPILHALLAANHTVTVLTRLNSTSTSKLPAHPSLTIKEVDFTSTETMTPALKGVDVVVSSVATAALGAQNPLIDAAVLAGISRFVPAEFGMDSANTHAMLLPVCAPKTATQRYLTAKTHEKEGFSWTAIANGWFLDWVLRTTTILMDVKTHSATLYNGGDVRFSATMLEDIARAVLGVIEKRDETRNRVVYVQSCVVTQKQLIAWAEEKDGVAWITRIKTTEEMKREIVEAVGRGDVKGANLLSSIVGCGDAEYGCDYGRRTDNELLGVREMSEMELRALVQELM